MKTVHWYCEDSNMETGEVRVRSLGEFRQLDEAWSKAREMSDPDDEGCMESVYSVSGMMARHNETIRLWLCEAMPSRIKALPVSDQVTEVRKLIREWGKDGLPYPYWYLAWVASSEVQSELGV